MTVKIYLPRDSTALALDAEKVRMAIVAEARRLGMSLEIVRTGSRGMFWLEPLVEVQTADGRVGYGPVQEADVPALFASGFHVGSTQHPLSLGPVERLPYLKGQERLSFARLGVVDPLSLNDYLRHDGYQGLQKALGMSAAVIIKTVTDSGLRGRGGAAFPTGLKWKTASETKASQKYVVCNADEGDSGTFADRLVMEGDPFSLIEGMTIAAVAVSATKGYIYVRSEYPHAVAALDAAIQTARNAGYLGEDILGSGKQFDLEVRKGAGAYICGEETALLESLEGNRGIVRSRPPLPASRGLFNQPTIVNNVLSLSSVPVILQRGAEFYRDFGMGRSRGTLAIQLGGNIKYGGLIEKAFGITLREVLFDYGGGSASGRPIKAVQVGGPLGTYLPESHWDIPLDYEAFSAAGAVLGHGGIVVHDDSADLAQLARYAMKFCAIESCGKCTPCRIGSTRGVEIMDKIIGGNGSTQQVQLLRDLCDTMVHGSLCAMGSMTPLPVLSALDHFPDDFRVS